MKRRRNISSRNAAVGRHTNSIDQRCLGLEFNSPPTIYQSVPGRSAWIKLRRVPLGRLGTEHAMFSIHAASTECFNALHQII